MKKRDSMILLDPVLDLFDGAGGASGGGSAAAGDSAGGSGGGATPGGGAAAAGAGEKVVYGKQAAPESQSTGEQPAGEQNPRHQTSSDTMEERARKWRELSAEYKDLYDQDVRRMTSRSEREAAALRDQAARAQPVLDMLMERYKIEGGDMGKLLRAVEDDSDYLARAAEEAGMSVEQYKQFQRLKRQNQELLRAQEQQRGRQFAQQQFQRWNSEAAETQKVYPSFDLSREVQNRDFWSMLKAGVPVKNAYEVIHMDEIRAATAAMQAKATEKAVTANIKAKGARPQESGAGAGSGFTVKDDVSRLTAKDRAEIARRAARGEVITF